MSEVHLIVTFTCNLEGQCNILFPVVDYVEVHMKKTRLKCSKAGI